MKVVNLLVVVLILSWMAVAVIMPASAAIYRDGIYEGGSPDSVYGKVRLKVKIVEGKITDIIYREIPDWDTEKVETMMRNNIIKNQSTEVDEVTGATVSYELIKKAVDDALETAAQPAAPPAEKPVIGVLLETTQGNIEIRLYPKKSQMTVENFVGLVEKGYYDGIIFHRVIPGFMVQGGDPTGTGRGGESLWGRPFQDEFGSKLKFDKPGILAMANSGPNTNGSQFFITVAPTPWLNNHHTIFGEVVKGYDVVEKLERTPTGPGNRPRTEQKILKATLIRSAN
ncbi:MAG: peptidylprolyl isomerase [Candidatus Auribacterota bacterium]|nr:peptidylprolyl isomerase [Candidatus Auribacterota bacterium]